MIKKIRGHVLWNLTKQGFEEIAFITINTIWIVQEILAIGKFGSTHVGAILIPLKSHQT